MSESKSSEEELFIARVKKALQMIKEENDRKWKIEHEEREKKYDQSFFKDNNQKKAEKRDQLICLKWFVFIWSLIWGTIGYFASLHNNTYMKAIENGFVVGGFMGVVAAIFAFLVYTDFTM